MSFEIYTDEFDAGYLESELPFYSIWSFYLIVTLKNDVFPPFAAEKYSVQYAQLCLLKKVNHAEEECEVRWHLFLTISK